MTITSVKTYKRTTVETAWGAAENPAWLELTTSWTTSEKITATSRLRPDPLTRIFSRTWIDQAAFDEWHANPIVMGMRIQERMHEIANNITWTKVITNNETNEITTESSTDFTLSLSKG